MVRRAQPGTFLYIRSWFFLEPVVVIFVASSGENHRDVELFLLHSR